MVRGNVSAVMNPRQRWMPLLNLLVGRPKSTAFRLADLRDDRDQVVDGAVLKAREEWGAHVDRLDQRVADTQARTDDLIELMDRRILDLEAEVRRLERRDEQHAIPFTDEQYRQMEEAVDVVGENRLARLEALLGHLPTGTGRLLDVGCGDGDLLDLCPRLEISAVGVDTNAASVSVCLDKGLDAHLSDGVDFLHTQPSADFDAVVIIHVVEHLPGPYLIELLAESARVLKPGGLLAIETPNVGSLSTLLRYYFADPTHLLPRRAEQYRAVIAGAGLDLVNEFEVGQTELPQGADENLASLGVYGATDLQFWARKP